MKLIQHVRNILHKRIGVTKESWYSQETENGYDIVAYTEAENANFMKKFKRR